jgi:hypothetical protein
LNELSGEFKSNEKSLLMKTKDDLRTTFDWLQASNNDKSDDYCHLNDSAKDISTRPDDDKKSM